MNDNDLVDRQRLIHERYPMVYPFNADQAKYVFHEHHDGGMIQVYTTASSTEQVALIQTHLKVEYDRFRTGNFSDEAKLHGQHMPGIKNLSENYSKIKFVYSDLPNGAQIQLTADNPKLINAIHIWFRAQLLDHGADADAHMNGMDGM